MRQTLLVLMLAGAAWAQTKAAPPAATAPKAATTPAPKPTTAPKAAATKAPAKAATKAKAEPAMDLLKPDTIKGRPPAIFVVRLATTKGDIEIRVVRAWAPNGVERFYNLVRAGYYDNAYFFRALDFMVQTGINSNPAINNIWSEKNLFDDRVIQTNRRGMVTFAAGGQPNSRSTQFFINKTDANTYLDQLKFAPFGEVVAGIDVVSQIYTGYGEPPDMQGNYGSQGAPYIERNFPRMDKIVKASIIAVVEP